LSHISHLGLTKFVFPGATHTRLSHSIGVMSVMARICRQLKLSEAETRLLRLAALLHDVGQYPLSHVIETVYRVKDGQLAELVENPDALDSIQKVGPLQRVTRRPPGVEYARDKALAGEVITRRPDLLAVLQGNGVGEDDIEQIAKIVQGNHSSSLYHHLLDSEYDCDRLDYVGRDAMMAGVPYGRIDLDFLIQNMSAPTAPPGGSDRVLAIDKRKALHSLEHYLTSRYYMYSQVIFHKTVRSLELLAKAMFLELADAGSTYGDFEEIRASVPTADFLNFDDHLFWQLTREAAGRGDGPVARFASKLMRREPLRYVTEFKVLQDNDELTATYGRATNWLLNSGNLKLLAYDAQLTPEQVVAEELFIEFVPIGAEVPVAELLNNPIATQAAARNSPYLRNDDGSIELMISDPSTILQALSTKKLRMLRLYVDGTEREEESLRSAVKKRVA